MRLMEHLAQLGQFVPVWGPAMQYNNPCALSPSAAGHSQFLSGVKMTTRSWVGSQRLVPVDRPTNQRVTKACVST